MRYGAHIKPAGLKKKCFYDVKQQCITTPCTVFQNNWLWSCTATCN